MAKRNGFQIVHRGAEIRTVPRTPGAPMPLLGADVVPALLEEDTVPPMLDSEGVLAATGEIEVVGVDELSGPVVDPINSEPIFA
ncbi:MAG TPA: hypothetical protein VFW77_01690 [Candidatus Saccharimonadales bacterium]|nr:hypothetical protein [Candidatus Saccharimonadales bacterium]